MIFIKRYVLKGFSKILILLLGLIAFLQGCRPINSGEQIYLYGVKEAIESEELDENN